jgi:hypothetical protein
MASCVERGFLRRRSRVVLLSSDQSKHCSGENCLESVRVPRTERQLRGQFVRLSTFMLETSSTRTRDQEPDGSRAASHLVGEIRGDRKSFKYVS